MTQAEAIPRTEAPTDPLLGVFARKCSHQDENKPTRMLAPEVAKGACEDLFRKISEHSNHAIFIIDLVNDGIIDVKN